MKLVFFGDSLTWGGYGGDWVAEIARRCPNHTIINAGVGGNTVVNLLRRVEADVIAHEPDGVFVMVGGNDSISHAMPQTRPYYRKSQAIPDGVVTPDLFTSSYRDLLTELHLHHIQTWIGLAPAEYNPAVVEAKRQYNALAAEVARAFNVPVLDLFAHMTPPPDAIKERPPVSLAFIDRIGQRAASGWDDYAGESEREGYTYSFDGLHLTPEAALTVAGLVIDFLELPGCTSA